MSPFPIASAPDWLVWQLVDSALPTGGFAHSGGIEAVWRAGAVRSVDDLVGHLRGQLQSNAHLLAPLSAAACQNPAAFADVDERCDAILNNHIANRASRAQGQALIATAGRIFAVPALSDFLHQRNRSTEPQHWAPSLGAVAGLLGLQPRQAAGVMLYSGLRGMISAAVRLGIVGPLQGQAIQASVAAEGEALVDEAISIAPNDIAQTAPIFDLLHGAHDRLYSRLFVS